jgi:CheY-like chemotaxis protein
MQTTHILLIEDNLGDTQLFKIFMKDAAFKFELYVAETFFEGAEILNKQSIDVVILDLSLPDSTGFKTLNRFFELNINTPVIVLTGVNNEIVGNQAIKAGAQDYLVKGQFDGKLLGRAIRYGIQRYKEILKLEETKRELTMNERRSAKVQQISGFGNWEMDLVSNEMIWNDEVFRILGALPSSMATGLTDYLNYAHFDDRELVEDFFESATKDGKLHKVEHRIVLDGVSLKWLSVHAQVFVDELTQRTLLVGGIQDITERKTSEQLIVEQNISRQTSLLKEEALNDLSFHIRTPLTSVVNLLYLLESTNVSHPQKELVEGLKVSVDDISLTINNLLNFSMLVSQNLRPENDEFYFKDFLGSLQKVIQIKTDKAKIKLDFTTPEELPDKIIADNKKLTQIIYNVIDHVIRYTPQGGKMSVLFNMLNPEKKTSSLHIKVAYSGKALSINQIRALMEDEKILETLQNDPSESDKQQLALAIVSKLVKILKGDFNIVNKGADTTIFDIHIPVTAVRQVLTDAHSPQSALKILLVEDHFLNQMATKKLLLSWSPYVSVDIAENGLVAVDKCRAHGYDIVLMDLQMPVMNGSDAAIHIRELSIVPIIALTANASKQEATRCFEIGMNDYMSKPFKPQDLYIKIMNALSLVSDFAAPHKLE